MDKFKKRTLTEKEKKLISKHKWKEFFWSLLVLMAAIFLAVLWLGSNGNIILIIIGIIPVVIFYFQVDSHVGEIRRIQSGYYEKEYGFKCKKCDTEIKIPFCELEGYNDLPRDEADIRVIECPGCQKPLRLYGYDEVLKTYKEYVEYCMTE